MNVKNKESEELKNIKVLKKASLLIPIFIILYLVYSNFIISKEFNYFYDIGSEDDNYLSPTSRISEKFGDEENYRNLTHSLVYFESKIPRGSKNVEVEVKLKDNFPEREIFRIGAKDSEEWHYKWNFVYSPGIEEISKFEYKKGIYKFNEQANNLNSSDLVIASTNNLNNEVSEIKDFEQKTTFINTGLRGGHTFYAYLNNSLDLTIEKQDINWYNGTDELNIRVYNSSNNFIANFSIQDDEIDSNSKQIKKSIKNTISLENIKEGVYKIVADDFDGLIKSIKINTNKIVIAERVYLADSNIFSEGFEKKSTLYTEYSRSGTLSFKTWHNAGLQNLTINQETLTIDKIEIPTIYNSDKGSYLIESEINDLIIESPGYFSFSQENYLKPFKNKIIEFKPDIDWLKSNVDYAIIDYKSPIKEKDNLIIKTNFNIDEVYLKKNNILSFAFNTPYLEKEEFNNQGISIDWINITIYKPGVWK